MNQDRSRDQEDGDFGDLGRLKKEEPAPGAVDLAANPGDEDEQQGEDRSGIKPVGDVEPEAVIDQ